MGDEASCKHGRVVSDRAEDAARDQDLDQDLFQAGLSGKFAFDVSVNVWDTKSRPDCAQDRRTEQSIHVQEGDIVREGTDTGGKPFKFSS